MGQIKFARVDSRMIHGQVVTKWSKGVGSDSVYVVDDTTAKDDFMKMILEGSGKTYGFKVKVFSKEAIIEEWNNNQFGNQKVFVIFKDIPTAVDVIKAGLPTGVLNIGGVPKKADSKQINASVFLTEQDLTSLNEIKSDQNIDVFIQTVPDTQRLNISEVKL